MKPTKSTKKGTVARTQGTSSNGVNGILASMGKVMKRGKQSLTIRAKFLILMVFIALIASAVGVVALWGNYKLSELSHTVTRIEIPRSIAIHEAIKAIQMADVNNAIFLDGDGEGHVFFEEKYAERPHEYIDQAHAYLNALAFGSDSATFKNLNEGKWFSVWETQKRMIPGSLPPASGEFRKLALEVDMYVTGYEANIHKLHIAHGNEEASSSIADATSSAPLLGLGEKEEEEVRRANEDYMQTMNLTLSKLQEFSEKEITDLNETISDVTSEILLLMIIAFVLGTVVVFAVCMQFLNLIIVKPLAEMTDAAAEIATGKLTKRVAIETHDEMGRLGETLNTMAANLQNLYANLEHMIDQKTQQLKTKNVDLERSQLAIANVLEDLEDEKHVVEKKVKERTRDLEREQAKLLQVTKNMRGGGILLDPKGAVIFANEVAYRLLGLAGDTDNEHVLPGLLANFQGTEIHEHLKKCLEGVTFDVPEITDTNGRVYEMFFRHLTSTQGGKGKTTGYFISFIDITETKLLERSKSELVAVASHQLRTPLTAMRGNVEMLIDESFGKLNPEQHDLLSDIDISTERLITMVNDMLDITKIERGNLDMRIEDLSVKELIDSIMTDLTGYAEKHNITIDTTGLGPDAVVRGDRVRVRQVFQNLVDNAIKYSRPPGKLTIAASLHGAAVKITFADNGIGIPKNERAKIFGRFYRASNTANTTSSGSGLGLYIVKSITQQLGGDIRFESTENVGTTFTVTLPRVGGKKV